MILATLQVSSKEIELFNKRIKELELKKNNLYMFPDLSSNDICRITNEINELIKLNKKLMLAGRKPNER